MQTSAEWQAMLRKRIAELEKTEAEIKGELKQLRSLVGKKAGAPRKAASGKPRAKRGQRQKEFVKAVKAAEPEGITVAEIAKQTGAQAPGLYPLAKKLVSEGVIKKKGNKYVLAPEGS